MNVLLPRLISILLIALLSCVELSGCATRASSETKIPVNWNGGFTLPELLASSDKSFNNINDLQELIVSPWYAAVSVSQTKVGDTTLSSCQEYFNKAGPTTRTSRDNEMNAYLEFKVMCDAARELMNAHEARKSFLPKHILSPNVPKIWPKEMALQISVAESKRAAANNELIFWDDITVITRHETQSTAKSTYFHEGGYQEIEVVGRGDINHDGVEDVIVISRDHVTGGTYFNLRLFVLSVGPKGNWELIKSL